MASYSRLRCCDSKHLDLASGLFGFLPFPDVRNILRWVLLGDDRHNQLTLSEPSLRSTTPRFLQTNESASQLSTQRLPTLTGDVFLCLHRSEFTLTNPRSQIYPLIKSLFSILSRSARIGMGR